MTSPPLVLHPLHIPGAPECHRTVRLLLSCPSLESTFPSLLMTHLEASFGPEVQIEARSWSGSPPRFLYQLSGDWHRPVEVHDALVLLFSSFTGEPADDG